VIPTEFAIFLLQSERQMGLAITTALAWVATCDGSVDERERSFIQSVGGDQLSEEEVAVAIQSASRGDIRDLQLVSEILGKLEPEQKGLFLDLAVGVAISDSRLTVSENVVVRYFADLLGLGMDRLDQAFLEQTGHDCPEVSDLSSADWWDARARSDHSSSEGTWKQRRTRQKIIEAYAVLGVPTNAPADEVRQAYRRLAKVHHPDKYESLGPEAVRAATQTFQRIQSAYKAVMAQ